MDSRHWDRLLPAVLTYAAVLVLSSLLHTPASGLVAAEASFDYLRSPDVPVVEYVVGTGELAGPGTRLTIYGDGRLEMEVPEPLPDAGTHVGRATAAQLTALLAQFVDRGLVEFDRETVRRRKREVLEERRREALARGDRPEVSAIADAATTRLRFQLENYVPAESDVSPRPVDKQIAWYALAWHVEEYPELDALRDLLDAVQQIDHLIDAIPLEKTP